MPRALPNGKPTGKARGTALYETQHSTGHDTHTHDKTLHPVCRSAAHGISRLCPTHGNHRLAAGRGTAKGPGHQKPDAATHETNQPATGQRQHAGQSDHTQSATGFDRPGQSATCGTSAQKRAAGTSATGILHHPLAHH